MPEKKISYRKAIYSAIERVMSADDRTVFIGEDIAEYGGAFGVAADLYKKFPGRVISAPISEGGFTGVAVGMAMTGYRVITEIMFMDFITLALDQIINHAANVHYMYGGQLSCPIVIRTPAGGYRGYGPSHSKAMEAMLIGIPGIRVVAPSTPADAYGCFLSAVYDNNPVVFVEHKLLYNIEEEADLDALTPVELGKAKVLRQGSDVTLVSHSYGTVICREAIGALLEEGIDVELIDLRSIKPLDMETVSASVTKTGRLVYVEEGNVAGGVGAEVVSAIAEAALPYIDGRLVRVGRPDVPIPASTVAEGYVLPDKQSVISAVKRSLTWK